MPSTGGTDEKVYERLGSWSIHVHFWTRNPNPLLHVIRYGNIKRDAERYYANQWWTAQAAAVFIMTSVFERSMWRYKYSRALRSIYIEAGHLCQTFCLTATAMKLAPFCTAALSDSLIEQELGIDGIRESVLYMCAAGHVRNGSA